jgi:hypothetical protein
LTPVAENADRFGTRSRLSPEPSHDPPVDPREDAKRKRVRFTAIATTVTILVATTLSWSRFRGWAWVLWLVFFAVVIVVTSFMLWAHELLRSARLGAHRPG